MIPDRVCARCGAARHTTAGVCPACGYDGIAAATNDEFIPVAPANPPSRCPHCGTVHAWGETNCRQCGRRMYTVCRSCRAANSVGHRFCIYCGAGMPVGVPNQTPSVTSLTRWRPFSAAAELTRRTIPDAYWSFLLPFGLLGIVAAQLVFGLGDSRELPGFGVFAILVGITAIALWAATAGQSIDSIGLSDSAPGTNSTPRIVQSGKRYPKLIALGIGGVMSLVLLVRVSTGTDNTWDVGLWLGSIAAGAAVFVPADYRSSHGWRPTKLLEYARGRLKRNWRGILPLLAILAIYCVLTVPNLTAWRYAALGDEYLFYEHARRALEMGTTNPFSQNGVYDNNPEFNTLYKAGWMALFGEGHFGWKMTGVASMVLAISGMYALGGVLGGRATAIAAAGFLAASHYLFGLLNGGYNHLDALPVTIWTMVAFVLGLQKRDLLVPLSGRSRRRYRILLSLFGADRGPGDAAGRNGFRQPARISATLAGDCWVPAGRVAHSVDSSRGDPDQNAGADSGRIFRCSRGAGRGTLDVQPEAQSARIPFQHDFAHLRGWATAGSDHWRPGSNRNWSGDWKSKQSGSQSLFNLDRRGFPGDRIDLALSDNGDHPSVPHRAAFGSAGGPGNRRRIQVVDNSTASASDQCDAGCWTNRADCGVGFSSVAQSASGVGRNPRGVSLHGRGVGGRRIPFRALRFPRRADGVRRSTSGVYAQQSDLQL